MSLPLSCPRNVFWWHWRAWKARYAPAVAVLHDVDHNVNHDQHAQNSEEYDHDDGVILKVSHLFVLLTVD